MMPLAASDHRLHFLTLPLVLHWRSSHSSSVPDPEDSCGCSVRGCLKKAPVGRVPLSRALILPIPRTPSPAAAPPPSISAPLPDCLAQPGQLAILAQSLVCWRAINSSCTHGLGKVLLAWVQRTLEKQQLSLLALPGPQLAPRGGRSLHHSSWAW